MKLLWKYNCNFVQETISTKFHNFLKTVQQIFDTKMPVFIEKKRKENSLEVQFVQAKTRNV